MTALRGWSSRSESVTLLAAVLSQLRGRLATDVLQGFPFFECGLHRQKNMGWQPDEFSVRRLGAT